MNRHRQVFIEYLQKEVCVLQEHLQHERNHQELENSFVCPEFRMFQSEGEVDCRRRLGGLLRYC